MITRAQWKNLSRENKETKFNNLKKQVEEFRESYYARGTGNDFKEDFNKANGTIKKTETLLNKENEPYTFELYKTLRDQKNTLKNDYTTGRGHNGNPDPVEPDAPDNPEPDIPDNPEEGDAI